MVEEMFLTLIQTFGYLGIFLVGFLSTASIILPVPGWIIIFGLGATFNPLAIGIAAGLGAALGEITGYAIGLGGRKVFGKRTCEWLKRTEKIFKRYGFAAILVFAATPLPDDITGILAGSVKYEIKKFLLACAIGKIIFNTALAYAGYYSVNWVLQLAGIAV